MKKIVLSGLLLLLSFGMYAQDMRTVFVNMPDSLSPLLTKVNREDFADFLESNMRAQVKNKFDSNSEMKILTKDYLLLQLTANSTQQMKLLPMNDSVKVVCVVNTVSAPAEDSSVSFYTSDWKELPSTDFLIFPTVDSFYISSDTIDVEKQQIARQKADMNLIKAELSEKDHTLKFTYTTIDYLNKPDSTALQPFLKPEPLVYRWNNNKFVPVN